MDDLADEGRIARGSQAAREFKELSAAFDSVEAAFVEKLSATPITLPDVVLRIHAGIQALHAVKAALNAVIYDGQMAEHAVASTGVTRPY